MWRCSARQKPRQSLESHQRSTPSHHDRAFDRGHVDPFHHGKSAAELNLLSPEALQAYKVEQVSSVKTPYIFIGLLLVALAMVHLFPALAGDSPGQRKGHTPGVSLWKYATCPWCCRIFVYVGAEVAIGTFLIKYFHLHEIGDLPEAQGQACRLYHRSPAPWTTRHDHVCAR